MNLLQIMRLANTASGLQGNIDTVANLREVQLDLYAFVQQANSMIQLKETDWKFLFATYQVSHDGTASITNTDCARWERVIYMGRDLRFVHYDEYLLSDWSAPGKPTSYTIVPETNELITNTFDQAYTLTIRYYRNPVDIVNNTDIPVIPVRFHAMIAYYAAYMFGSWIGSREVEDANASRFDQMMQQLQRSEVPNKQVNVTPMA